jgi:hypothetical protein
MRSKRVLLIAVLLSWMGSVAFAADPFSSNAEAYRIGYVEGYYHGAIDKNAGLEMNYKHSHLFQSGISYNTFSSLQFRNGYQQGYEDSYLNRPSQFAQFHDFESDTEAYDVGYSEGYNKGVADKESNLPPDYRRDPGLSADEFTVERFREGFEQGYNDGYDGHTYHLTEIPHLSE